MGIVWERFSNLDTCQKHSHKADRHIQHELVVHNFANNIMFKSLKKLMTTSDTVSFEQLVIWVSSSKKEAALQVHFVILMNTLARMHQLQLIRKVTFF